MSSRSSHYWALLYDVARVELCGLWEKDKKNQCYGSSIYESRGNLDVTRVFQEEASWLLKRVICGKELAGCIWCIESRPAQLPVAAHARPTFKALVSACELGRQFICAITRDDMYD